ncbi:putative tyrosine-protein phosphatase OCA1 [Bienertia sinuspersici]
MARLGVSLRRRKEFKFLQFIILMINIIIMVYLIKYSIHNTLCSSQELKQRKRKRGKLRLINIIWLTRDSEALCRHHLHWWLVWDKAYECGRDSCNFLIYISSPLKNKIVGAYFYRSGESITRQFHQFLKANLKLHVELLKKPKPITQDCDDDRWKYFKFTSSNQTRGRNKRFWIAEEDKALINALHELSTDPHWKCENGFRNGYMNRLEELIEKAIPGCGLKSSPHIDSRLKTLVGKFKAITQMLATSGFKWDDERNMISMDRSVYVEYCKSHPNCNNLYDIPFPHLHAMTEIYGKDYATGKLLKLFKMLVPWRTQNRRKMFKWMLTQVIPGNVLRFRLSTAPSLKKVKTEKKCKNKEPRKVATKSTNSELACLQDFTKDMNSHLSTMASVWSRADDREQDMADKSSQVLNDLQLEYISFNEAFEVANILTAQPNKLNIFFNCPTPLKPKYVKSLLGSSE